MSTMLDAVLFVVFVVLLIQLSRPSPLESKEVKVWSDELERRLLSGPPRSRR